MSDAQPNSTLEIMYKGWETYQGYLIAAITPLTEEQLALTVGSDLRSVGSLASHIVGARAGWLSRALKEGGDDMAALAARNASDAPMPTAAELVSGLQTTWACLRAALSRWTEGEMITPFQVERRGEMHTFTRAWIIWHLIEHDMHHGGELSYSLGIHGVTALDV